MRLGINTFGLNKLFAEDFEGTLLALKDMGITDIEPCIVIDQAIPMPSEHIRMGLKKSRQDGSMWITPVAAKRIAKIRGMGFQITGAQLMLLHMIPGGLRAALPYAKAFALENHLSYIASSPKEGSLEKAKALADTYRLVISELEPLGIDFIVHNHEMEVTPQEGSRVLDVLLDQVPQLQMELDVGWVKFAGADVIATMETYRDRISIIHFKDITADACPGNRNTCYTAIGEGSLPLTQVIGHSRKCALREIGYIIDQDSSNGDMLEELRRGIRNILNITM